MEEKQAAGGAALENEDNCQQDCDDTTSQVSGETEDEVYCSDCGAKTTVGNSFCPKCGKPLKTANTEMTNDEKETKSKKFKLPGKLWSWIVSTAGIIVITIIVFVLTNASAGAKDSNFLFYLKDEELYLSILNKMNTHEITSRLNDSKETLLDYKDFSSYVLISKNGRYIFYPDRHDYSGFTYYWVDLNKIKDKDREEVKIDSEIMSVPVLSENGDYLFYKKGSENRLYVYDRKSGEKSKLADNVHSYDVNSTGDYVLFNSYIEGESVIYEITLNNLIGEKTKIDSNAKFSKKYVDERKLYYIKDDVLYFKEFGKDKVKISSDVIRVVPRRENEISNYSGIYYLKPSESSHLLSDFVFDDMYTSDQNLSEPTMPEYPQEPTAPKKSDFTTKEWHSSSWGSEKHPVTDERGYWEEEIDKDAYNDAYNEYKILQFEWQNEVSDIHTVYTDEVNAYREKMLRDEARDVLAYEEYAVTIEQQDLYYWDHEQEVLVASDVTDLYEMSDEISAVVYKKYEASGGAKNLSEVMVELNLYEDYIDHAVRADGHRIVGLRKTSPETFIAVNGRENVIEGDDLVDWEIDKTGFLYFIQDYGHDSKRGTLMSAKISGDLIEHPVKIDEDVCALQHGNNNGYLYYYKDRKNLTADLYLSGNLIAYDVYISSIYNYAGSDDLIYLTDFSQTSFNGTLCVYKDGKQTKIADDVSLFSVIDNSKIAYLTDYNYNKKRGDLMLYNRKESVVLDTDVASLLWNDSMEWEDFPMNIAVMDMDSVSVVATITADAVSAATSN